MSSTFIPVDLDQVLDEFEEQERHEDSPPVSRPNSLDLPKGCQELKRHSISDPRTYSFNSPLEAILQEHSNTIDKAPAKSLAQELADLDIGAHDENVYNDDDDEADSTSDASSTTAVIVAAENITSKNDFTMDQPISSVAETNINDKSNSTENASSYMDTSNEQNVETLHDTNFDETDEPTDFLSVLNSTADESPFFLKDFKATTDNMGDDLLSNQLVNGFVDGAQHSNLENSVDMNNMSNGTNEEMLRDNSQINDLPNEEYHDLSDVCSGTTKMNSETSELSNAYNDKSDNDDKDISFESANISSQRDANFEGMQPELCNTNELSSNIDNNDSSASIPLPNDGNLNETQDLNTDNSIGHHLPEQFSITPQNSNNLLHTEDAKGDFSNDQIDRTENTSDDASGTLNIELEVETLNDNLVPSSDGLNEDTAYNDVIPSLENQMVNIDNSSTNSLCYNEATRNDDPSPMTIEVGGSSPVRAVSPEPQLEEGILPVHISSGDPEMGFVPPIWVPDDVATHCMTCGLKFSLIKRKHHCRACGRVLCSSCCNMKYPLPYLGNKDARVCQVCCDILIQGSQQAEQECTEDEMITNNPEDDPMSSSLPSNSDTPVDVSTLETETSEDRENIAFESSHDIDSSQINDDSNNEDATEACSTESGTQPVLVLPTNAQALPTNGLSTLSPSESLTSAPLSPALSDDSDLSFRLDVEHVRAIIPQDFSSLPPVLNLRKKAIHIQEHPDPAEIMYSLKGLGETVIFLLNKNLIVKVKIVKLNCCVKKKCWCFVTDGMGAANQEEMVVLLECEHKENTVPKDVLSHFNTALTYAKQGHVVSDLGFTIFGQPFLGSSNNAGFLYIKPTFQCLENLPLPTIPYVVGILIQRQEAPWAQLFPIRLMLRLGTEFRYYPCPLWSVRNRPSVYHEVGHTIMNLLTDFKNFQYSIPRVTGLVIHMENAKTIIKLPQDRFDEMVKVLNAAEEHMFAFGANFSSEADSHLVCIQEGESYKTQAINIQHKTRKVTGASFVVFTGSLKTSNPNDAKVSIIEDGIMIQMLPDSILELRKALREMQDYVITTGSNSTANTVTQVDVEWVSRDSNKQTYTSPIDGRSLTDVPSIQVNSSCDFSKRDIYRIRWTNVFLERNGSSSRGLSSRGLTRLTGELSRTCCEALRPHLQQLFDKNLTRLSLRVNIDSDSVEYSIGANQEPLPANLMADLDSALIPSINAAAMKHRRGPLTVELFFSVISLF